MYTILSIYLTPDEESSEQLTSETPTDVAAEISADTMPVPVSSSAAPVSSSTEVATTTCNYPLTVFLGYLLLHNVKKIETSPYFFPTLPLS